MPIYTGVADANGDFNISFGSNSYTSGEKITITAEKDNAEKSIELYAPSAVTGGNIRFSGTLDDYPKNIGIITISGITGVLNNHAFSAHQLPNFSMFRVAKGLVLGHGVTIINDYCFSGWNDAISLVLPTNLIKIKQYAFRGWVNCTSLYLPDSVDEIESYAFNYWDKCTSLRLPTALRTVVGRAFDTFPLVTSFTIPENIEIIQGYGFSGFSGCNEIIMERATPPAITSTSFYNLKTACVFKVPAGSVEAYKAAPNWSAFAARIQAI